jgi:hypothetical protein
MTSNQGRPPGPFAGVTDQQLDRILTHQYAQVVFGFGEQAVRSPVRR